MDHELQPEFLITDIETHKAIIHPLRIRILELLIDSAQTVKQLAAAVEMPPTKLYYHVNLLEKHGAIQVVETRIVSGIIEKWYRPTAYNYRLDRTVLSLQEDELEETLTAVFDGSKTQIRQGIAKGNIRMDVHPPHPHALLLFRSRAKLTPEQAADFHTRLQALLDDLESTLHQSDSQPEAQPEAQMYSLVIALFPDESRP